MSNDVAVLPDQLLIDDGANKIWGEARHVAQILWPVWVRGFVACGVGEGLIYGEDARFVERQARWVLDGRRLGATPLVDLTLGLAENLGLVYRDQLSCHGY